MLALEHCHAHGIVHRDVKLENLVLGLNGCVKLTDFDLAHTYMRYGGDIASSIFSFTDKLLPRKAMVLST